MTKKLIPFWMLPGSWGLKGTTREVARAEYEIKDPYERDLKIVEINHASDPERIELERLKVQKRHKKISEYDYQMHIAEEKLVGVDLDLRKLELDLEYGKIDEQHYAKMSATVRKEPYVAVINSSYDPNMKLEGFEFEFDWNHLWIEQLVSAGYSGHTEEQIVQRWFEDLCRSVVLESSEDQPIPFNSRRVANRTPRDGGKADYS